MSEPHEDQPSSQGITGSVLDLQKALLPTLERYGVTYTLISFGLALLALSLALGTMDKLGEFKTLVFASAGTALAIAGAIITIYNIMYGNRTLEEIYRTSSEERLTDTEIKSRERLEQTKQATQKLSRPP